MTYSFDPAAAGVGTHTITYTYTDPNGCTSSANDDVEVFDLPTLTFTAPADLCVDAGVQAGLGGATPAGGVYSGPGVTDDGNGMNLFELVEAMTPGSKDPKEDREEHDLGRFGLGLKTSSFSQCKALTVISKKLDHNVIKRHWDLDYVNETGKWNQLDYLSEYKFQEPLDHLEHGTTVLWEKLDRLVGNANVNNEAARSVFLEEFEKAEDHLSLVFHRYIERKKLTIWKLKFKM